MASFANKYSAPTEAKCYAAMTPKGKIVPHKIPRRACGPKDVVVEIKYAGICHSDIHNVEEDWGKGVFPMVPGHEIAGFVAQVGSEVKKFAVGQCVGVGCLVDSCRACTCCKAGEEQYCGSFVLTYNDKSKHPHMAEYNADGGAQTYGGYSSHIVVDQDFVVHVPTNISLAAAAPLLCAGITTYSPLSFFGVKSATSPDFRVAVVGLGGLGHMGVKFCVAFGRHTTVISRGTAKKESALKELHATEFLDSTDAEAMKAAAGKFDFILDTVSAPHEMLPYINLLKVNGRICIVGAPPQPFGVKSGSLIFGRKSICGSLIGGIHETQEMLDFCGQHNITCDIEMISANQIDTAYARTLSADVKYRFVIDAATF